MTVAFRPHHFLCTLCFQGKGYSNSFVENYLRIAETLNSPTGDNVAITIVGETDSICAPCPHREGTRCASQDKITGLDNAHAAAMQFQPGQTMTWGDAKKQIATHLTLDTFHQICATCSWKELGICESVIREFLK